MLRNSQYNKKVKNIVVRKFQVWVIVSIPIFSKESSLWLTISSGKLFQEAAPQHENLDFKKFVFFVFLNTVSSFCLSIYIY